MYILDMHDPFILGLDYLPLNKCCVDLSDMTLTVGVQGKSVTLEIVNSSLALETTRRSVTTAAWSVRVV